MFKIAIFLWAFCVYANAHGFFYKVVDGAIAIHISTGNNIALSDAKISIYAPEASLAYTKGTTDINGNFAFLPDSEGLWKVLINVPSDHGSHKKEFTINIDQNIKLKDYEKEPYERYFVFISSLGIIFGMFGLYSIYLRRKEKKL